MNTYLLGVMNITPNSFSDPGKNLNLEQFSQNLLFYRKKNVFCFDIGAESTAPKNAGLVDIALEKKRFEDYFFSRLHLFLDSDVFSIDTYRVETFFYVYEEIRRKNSKALIIWNDVSGVIDSCLDQFLKLCEIDKNIKYVASFTYNEKRELSSYHKDRACEKNAITEDFFKTVERYSNYFGEHNKERLIIDPAFGFSKTIEQNFKLLDLFTHGSLVNILKGSHLLIGLSKKSFLQIKMRETYPDLELGSSELLLKTEVLHQKYLAEIYQNLKKEDLKTLYFRIHDPNVFKIM